ncbi:MAG: amidase, partial [Proteobacteria bacterium]|nr:amidase [Pseudomonadota bacterium]
MESLLTLSGTRLAEMIRKREVTSAEVVETHIRYAQKVNPTLNAIIQDRFELARKEAREADEKVKTVPPEKLPPFHGVPCTIKECFALAGMPNTSGLLARKGVTAKDNAVTVSRLLSAGVIPLGVTNVPELCMWMETYNKIYGRTNNPYNPGHIVGGSSGGEGAIIGSGASPFGLGSDIGGSIRMPAFFNGIFGHKPTSLTVPNTGQYPVVHGDALRYLTTGPLCRRAEDLVPLMTILAGPDAEHPDLRSFIPKRVAEVKLSGLTVLDVSDNGVTPVSDDLRAAQKKCAEALAAR